MTVKSLSDIEIVIKKLKFHLTNTGIIIFAVHNPRYIEACLDRNIKFFKSSNNDQQLCICFQNDNFIPIFSREREY